jgi:hypothetical protein
MPSSLRRCFSPSSRETAALRVGRWRDHARRGCARGAWRCAWRRRCCAGSGRVWEPGGLGDHQPVQADELVGVEVPAAAAPPLLRGLPGHAEPGGDLSPAVPLARSPSKRSLAAHRRRACFLTFPGSLAHGRQPRTDLAPAGGDPQRGEDTELGDGVDGILPLLAGEGCVRCPGSGEAQHGHTVPASDLGSKAWSIST